MKLRFTQIAAAMLLGAGVSAMAQDAPNYVIVAQGPTTVTENKNPGKDGDATDGTRGWYGYNNFSGCHNLAFTLPENDSEVYLEMDICVNNPGMEAGAPAFTDIVWGGTVEGVWSDYNTGETIMVDGQPKTWKETANYFFVEFNYTTTGNWRYAEAEQMNDCYAEFLNNLKIGEWAHLSLPLSASPRYEKMNSKDFKNINVYFGRMFNNEYVFQGKNLQLVDHSREVVDKVIPTRFTFDRSLDLTIGGKQGEKGGSLYFQWTMSPTVDLSECHEDAYFCFDADITLVDPTADAELAIDQLINSSAGHGSGNIELRSGTTANQNEVECRSKECGWQMGKHTYRIPVKKFTSASTEPIDWAAVKSGRFYLYNDSPEYPELNVKFSNFSFVTPVEKGTDEEFEQPTIIDKPIETNYVFTQPASAGSGAANFVLGGDKETVAYMNIAFDPAVDVVSKEEAVLLFDAEITAVEGEEENAEMLKNLSGASNSTGVHLSSYAMDITSWSDSTAVSNDLKLLDWQFGKHTYRMPLASFRDAKNSVDWQKVLTCRMYIYSKTYNVGKVNFSVSNFRFAIPTVSDGNGEGDDDDVTSIEEVSAGINGDSEVVIYNLYGVQVYAGVYGEAQLPHGLYVVVGANGSKKVMF